MFRKDRDQCQEQNEPAEARMAIGSSRREG